MVRDVEADSSVKLMGNPIRATMPTPIRDILQGAPTYLQLQRRSSNVHKFKIRNRPMLFEVRSDAGPHTVLFGQHPNVTVSGELCCSSPANTRLRALVRATRTGGQQHARPTRRRPGLPAISVGLWCLVHFSQ